MPASATSTAPLAGAALDALLDRITDLKVQQKSIEAELSPLLEQLSFSWSAGRTSYLYPEPLVQQEQALKEAQRLAVATGAASEKQGKAFWTIKAARA